ncbi:putative O-glycosylation ligase, exosortase A system-associated [Erythrobacter aquimaris]|uniref:Putative O-glycosylation ligase, exosortase A system-associated n=1 Tax=Qipengyuania aquimaris TaxID=255984 RepID=A0A6I4TNK1_9SPHN|nr:putative O-glycosylation ligase, exosortase A system-associated [Qipengyuania aquimaris]MXO96760.1 putative O-glycosylation ligase, exosortase A system-associated [Qipengyuania aquimaris]
MFDFVILAFLAVLVVLGLRRPFIWVLTYLYVDIVVPQQVGYVFLPDLKVSLITFILAFAGWIMFDNKKGTQVSIRQGILLAFLIWCGFTTAIAEFPESAALKWAWVWKSMLFALFLPLVLRTRLRLEAAVYVSVLSLATIVISGGIKTLLTGGGYGVLVTLSASNSGIYEGSTLSTVTIACIPLVWWLAMHGTILPARTKSAIFLAVALTGASLLIPIGTQARTGLLCVAFLGLLLLRSVPNKFAFGAAAGLLVLLSIPFLPQSFQERMGTISNYQADQSASTRLQVWDWTLDYVAENPIGGGFDVYLANSFTYETVETIREGNVERTERTEVTESRRAFHSSYFEVLGEQGVFGFLLWTLLHGTGLVAMERLRRRGRESDDPELQRWGTLANALQQVQLVYLFGALFVGVAYQPFIMTVLAMQMALTGLVVQGDRRENQRERKKRLAARRERGREVASS